MSDNVVSRSLEQIKACGKVNSYDVMHLRGNLFRDDVVDRGEIENLLNLDASLKEKCPEWGWLLREALVLHTVDEAGTGGVVSVEKADWLIDHISGTGLVDSPERFEALVEVLETARATPDALVMLALDHIKIAVLENQGPVATGRDGEKKVICKSDVELLRRVLYGFGGDNGIAISRAEAEFLFDLNDATADYENDPAWADLFVKAIGYYLLATAEGGGSARRVEVDEHKDEGRSLLSRFGALMRGAKRAATDNSIVVDEAFGEQNKKMQSQLRSAEVVTSDEATWIADRIGRDGELHENEKALLRFVREESHDLHPSLEPLLEQSA